MSKGSNRRPQEVDEAAMAENWGRAFGVSPAAEALEDIAALTKLRSEVEAGNGRRSPE